MEYLSPSTSKSPESTTAPEQGPFVVGHKKMKQGLFARAALYANNTAKATPALSQFNGILRANRDPIVWGDASNRYTYKRTETNNNNTAQAYQHERQGALSKDGAFLQLVPDVIPTDTEKDSNTSLTDHDMPTKRQEYQYKHQSMTSNDESPVQFSKDSFPSVNDGKISFSLPIPDDTIHSDFYEMEANLLVFDSDVREDLTTIEKEVVNEIDAVPPMSIEDSKVSSFNTTQQLRSGFFRSIKRQYSPLLPVKTANTESPTTSSPIDGHSSISNDENIETTDPTENEPIENSNSMSQLAKQKLEQLRKRGPQNVDVQTGLQWIRLELHEMREQDKTLFLQLIKLHSTIKDLRSDVSGAADFDSYDDLHSAASLWWPRKGCNIDVLPDFSSSDGAHLIRSGKSKPPLRRGFSLNYPPTAARRYIPGSHHYGSLSTPSESESCLDVESSSSLDLESSFAN